MLDAADVERLHANLMASPGHRTNLLNPNYTEVGLGIEQGDYVTLVADGDTAEATIDTLSELLTTDHDAE